ncbi:MAG: hypothetical protein M1832_001397 [Thelocarpon impressellum]|nr:MAG: hypothetical protein M1832_001397 [Thelocarpon impressellum]
MSAAAASSEKSDPPNRHLFPTTLRKGKGPPSSTSRKSSVVDDESSESQSHGGLRSSLDSGTSKNKGRSEEASSNDSSKLKGLLLKAKPKSRRKQREEREAEDRAAEEARRGRSVGERGTLENEPRSAASRSPSTGSRATRRSDGSRLTYDSDENSSSHAGYLTHSSPLIQQSAAEIAPIPIPIPVVQVDNGLPHRNSLPLGSSISSSRSISPTSAAPKKAATLQPSQKTRRRPSFDGRGADGISPVTKLKEVLKGSSRTVTESGSPDRDSTSANTSGGLKGLFGKKSEDPLTAAKDSTITTPRRSSKSVGDPAPAPPTVQTSGISELPREVPETPPGASAAPATTVTPPTPTGPQPPLQAGSSPRNENIVTSPSGQMISHRRVRSSSSVNPPSKLSNAISTPLTPTLEESRSPSGTVIAPSDRAAGQSGFFSSVFSAAQNAATTLGNTISSNPLGPGAREKGVGDQDQAGGEEVVTSTFGGQDAHGELVAGEPREQRPLAVETLGSGELSLSHLGISLDAPSEDSNSAMATPARSAAFTENFDSPAVHGDVDRAQNPGNPGVAPAATWSTTTGDEGARTGPSPGRVGRGEKASVDGSIRSAAEGVMPGIAHRSTYEPSVTGDRTPPSMRDWDRDSGLRRSGSVRSRTDNSVKRQRGGSNATGTTIGTAIGASNATLANPAANGSVPRLTGFAVASKKRNRDFHQTFRSVPEDDYLIEDYSAAFQKDILLHGRFYVSEGHICFNSNIFGYVTTLIISFDEVVSIEKKNTAMFIPNGLVVQTLHAKNVFASFTSRDSTYDLLIGIWKIGHPNLRSSLNGVELAEAGGGDKTVKQEGAPSEEESDDDYGEDEEVYDEDEEEEDGLGSFTEAGDGSIAGSEVGEAGVKVANRKASAIASTNGATNSAHFNGDSKGEPGDGGGGTTAVDFPGPPTHVPTECSDGDTHYDKVLKDEVIQAPLGKVYSLMFGPASGVFMSKWLVEDQKVLELQMEDGKKGLGEEKRTRTYSYIKPLNGSIGPKQTKCIITENLDAINLEKAVSVTITTQTPDVPSGNAFSTKTKYCLMWAEGNATRVLMNCTIEWTGKSWLKGPIEKGANDGQVAYGNDIVSALRAAVSARTRGQANGKGKLRRRKKDASDPTNKSGGGPGGAVGTKTSGSTSKAEHWGLLEPVRGPLGPVVDMMRPLLSSNVVIGVLLFVLVTGWLRGPRVPISQAESGLGHPHGGSPGRLAAYEEIWRREESALWDWLDERLGLPQSVSAHADDASSPEPKAPRARAVGKDRDLEARLADEKMDAREVDDAIRVTQERLDALRAVVERRKRDKAKDAPQP